jgi:predicted nucleic acid-binding protein
MVASLLDSSVVVDILRQYPPALAWYSSQTGLGVSQIVWLEILEGVHDKREQSRALTLLKDFDRVDLTTDDFEWATAQLIRYKLSHNTGMMDCLIASISHRLRLPLYTNNLKHFAPLLGSLAQRPY